MYNMLATSQCCDFHENAYIAARREARDLATPGGWTERELACLNAIEAHKSVLWAAAGL